MSAAREFSARHLKACIPVLCLIVPLVIAALLADQFGSIGINRSVTEALIKIVIVVGLYIFIGNSGVISLGGTAFIAIAAYATTWQTCCSLMKPMVMSGLPEFLKQTTVPFVPAAIIAVTLAGLAAFLSGLVLMRLSGLAAAIGTLALLFIVNVTYSKWDSVTMGASSVVGIPTYVTVWVALGAAIVTIIVAYVFQTSRAGLALRATREDEVAAQSVGISIFRMRLLAFTLSGFVLGLAGVLYAHFLGVLSIDMFFMQLTFLTLSMLVVGGMGSLSGAVVGVVSLSVVIEVFRTLERGIWLGDTKASLPPGSQELVLAVIMLCILIWRRDGIMGWKEITWPVRRSTPDLAARQGADATAL